MATETYFLDKLKQNENAKIIISSGKLDGLFQGYIRNDLTIAIGTQYTSFFKIANIDYLADILNKTSIAAGSVAGLAGDPTRFSNIQLKTPALTSLVWMGTESPTFTIPLTIIAWRESDNVLKTVKELYRTVLPTTGKVGGVNAFMEAPMGYSAGSALDTKSPIGTLTIKIGKWFSAQYQVMQNVSFDISRIASNANGDPLYADGAITFKPYRDITFADFETYFPLAK